MTNKRYTQQILANLAAQVNEVSRSRKLLLRATTALSQGTSPERSEVSGTPDLYGLSPFSPIYCSNRR